LRRNLVKMFLGAAFVVFLSPLECTFLYCDRHSFNPPICDLFLVPV
jgi:hypothetical protein